MYNNLVNLGKLYRPTVKYNNKRTIRNIFSRNELFILHPNCDIPEIRMQYYNKKYDYLDNNKVEYMYIEDGFQTKAVDSNVKFLIVNEIDNAMQLLKILQKKNLTQLIALSCDNYFVIGVENPEIFANLTHFTICIDFQVDFILDILNNFVNLEHLTLYCRDIEFKNKLFNNHLTRDFKELKSIKISFDTKETNHNTIEEKSIIEFINLHQNLEKLMITHCSKLTGSIFNSINSKSLRELTLSIDTNKKTSKFKTFKLCDKVPNLTLLTLINFDELSDEFWIDIINNHKHVKSVTIGKLNSNVKKLFKNSSIRLNQDYNFDDIIKDDLKTFLNVI